MRPGVDRLYSVDRDTSAFDLVGLEQPGVVYTLVIP